MTHMETEEGSIMVTPFGVEVSNDAAATPVVVVRGEIDVATSPQLRNELNALVARGARVITLDFEEVSFVDSSGLGVLVGTYKRLRDEEQGSIRIVIAQASVRKVFEITGLQAALLDG
jgi:anti-sigma B factor antagonist